MNDWNVPAGFKTLRVVLQMIITTYPLTGTVIPSYILKPKGVTVPLHTRGVLEFYPQNEVIGIRLHSPVDTKKQKCFHPVCCAV